LAEKILDDICRETCIVMTDAEEDGLTLLKNPSKPTQIIPRNSWTGVSLRVDELLHQDEALRQDLRKVSLSPKVNKTNPYRHSTNKGGTFSLEKVVVPSPGENSRSYLHTNLRTKPYRPLRINETGYTINSLLARETDPTKIVEIVSENLLSDLLRNSVGELTDWCDTFVGKVVNTEFF